MIIPLANCDIFCWVHRWYYIHEHSWPRRHQKEQFIDIISMHQGNVCAKIGKDPFSIKEKSKVLYIKNEGKKGKG